MHVGRHRRLESSCAERSGWQTRRRSRRPANATRLRRFRHPHRARRHLVLSRLADRPPAAGQAVRIGAAARRGRRYWLVTPAERGRITVEDAPFVAVELTRDGEGRDAGAHLSHQSRRYVAADDDHPLRVATDAATRRAAVPMSWYGTGWKRGLSRAGILRAGRAAAQRSGSATRPCSAYGAKANSFRWAELDGAA